MLFSLFVEDQNEIRLNEFLIVKGVKKVKNNGLCSKKHFYAKDKDD
jgi:hypothetical protein